MAKIEVLRVQGTLTLDNPTEAERQAIVDYGGGRAVTIPLPAHYLLQDEPAEQRCRSVEAMESLARALLHFADHTRKQWPNDWA